MGLHVNQALGTVFVNRAKANQRNIPKDLRDLIDGRFPSVLVYSPAQWCPRARTDFYVYRSRLTVAVEHAASIAAGNYVHLVCMSPHGQPIGGPYLAAEITRRCSAGDDVWIFQANSDDEWLHRTD